MVNKILIYDRNIKEKESLEIFQEYRQSFKSDEVLSTYINNENKKDNFYIFTTEEPDIIVFGLTNYNIDWYVVFKTNEKRYQIVKFSKSCDINRAIDALNKKGYDIEILDAIIPLIGEDFLYKSSILMKSHFKPEFIFYTYEIKDKPYSKYAVSKIKPYLLFEYEEGKVENYEEILELLLNINVFSKEECYLTEQSIDTIMEYFKKDEGEFGGFLIKNDSFYQYFTSVYGKYSINNLKESRIFNKNYNKIKDNFTFLERKYLYVYGKAYNRHTLRKNLNSEHDLKEKVEVKLKSASQEKKADLIEYLYRSEDRKKKIQENLDSLTMNSQEKELLRKINRKIYIYSLMMSLSKQKKIKEYAEYKDKYNMLPTSSLDDYKELDDEEDDFDFLMDKINKLKLIPFHDSSDIDRCKVMYKDYYQPNDFFHIHPKICACVVKGIHNNVSSIQDKMIFLKRSLKNIKDEHPLCVDIVFFTEDNNYYTDIIQYNPYLDYIFRKNKYLKNVFTSKMLENDNINKIFNQLKPKFKYKTMNKVEMLFKKFNWNFIQNEIIQQSDDINEIFKETVREIPKIWNLIKNIPIFLYNFEMKTDGKIPSFYVKYTYNPQRKTSVDKGNNKPNPDIMKSLSLIQKHEETDIKKSYENFLLNLSNQ